MSLLKPNNKDQIIDPIIKELNKLAKNYTLSTSLNKNLEVMKELFKDDDNIIYRKIENDKADNFRCCIVYCKTIANADIINENIIKPIMLSNIIGKKDILDIIKDKVVHISEIKEVTDMQDIISDVTYGDTILFIDKINKALILNTKTSQTRAITEPESERTLSGPREGFTESLLMNLSLIQKRMRTNELKMKYITLGRKTQTKLCVCYVDSIVNKKILDELYRRLDTIDMDGILDSNYISEMIKDNNLALFRTTGYTEKPDTVVGKLLEGRIALFVDGSPVAMTIPFLFIENFQSSEDYYQNFYYASFSRLIRFLGFFLTLTVPAIYLAIGSFHHEMFPTQLFINIAAERQGVPLPASIEAFIMLIVFDILRETGIRMPSNIGQVISTVGALVIGQAAVEAKLIAAPMIIIVAITGISGLLIPKLNESIIPIRLFLLLAASTMGLFGLVLGISALLISLLNLTSFGISQMTPVGSLQFQEVKDTYIRAPWWKMITRPKVLTPNKKRMINNGDNNDNK